MQRSLFFVGFFISLSLLSQQGQGWFQRASVPAPGRHRCAAITIGDRIYTGLGHVNAVVDILYGDWWEFDPGSNSWTQKANYMGGPTHHPFAFSIGNLGYVGTGRTSSGANTTAFYCYDPLTNSWTQKAPFGGAARRGSVGFAIGNKGYAGTGNTSMSGYTNDFWVYDPQFDSWSPIASFPGGLRFAAVGFSIGNKGYCGTGEQSNAPAGSKRDLWEYDPQTNQWTQKTDVPGPNRLAACGFSCNGFGYVGTGEDFQSGNNYSDFYTFNPLTNLWDTIDEFSGIARRYMVGTGVGSHAFAGWGTNGTNYNDWWEYGYMSGVDDNSVAEMICFPNPATDFLTLKNIQRSRPACRQGRIKIQGMQGQLLKSLDTGSRNEIQVAIHDLAKGIYFITVESSGGKIQTIKFVKQ